MQPRSCSGIASILIICGIAVLGAALPAEAVPSFARQTGLACEACHTVFPELTPFGRRFKLSGYQLTTRPSIGAITEEKANKLSLADLPPLSAMVQLSSTWLGKPVTDSALPSVSKSQNGDVQFPQALSLFYGGKVADGFGALFQLTYLPSPNSIGIDNSDIRFVGHAEDNKWIYGVTLNNNPTVQDVWNSTPAWGFPFLAAPSVPSPAAVPVISSLGQQSAGLGGYVFYDDSLYLELGGYRSAKTGTNLPLDSTSGNVIDNVAPYWRAAYETQWGHNTLEVGTFGMQTKLVTGGSSTTPVSISPGAADHFVDIGLDSQYQYITDDHIFSVLASYIHEHQSWDGRFAAGTASNSTDYLDQVRLTGSYYYQRTYGGSISLASISGSADPLIYAPGITTGSANGKPTTQSATFELAYTPFLNTKIALQYVMYNKFNGGSDGYDGVSGRKASDNNTIFLSLWTAF